MGFTLENVVPWGRNLDEYIAMFSLSANDLSAKTILGCGDGPASFNTELSRRGGRVVSVDPIYQFTADEIEKRIAETFILVMDQTRKNKDEFVWKDIESEEALGRIRMAAMATFLEDYEERRENYIAGALPDLAFHDGEFDLALCSHFLFLYSEQFSLEFHIRSLKELCRVAQEVRVFPLLALGSTRSRHLDGVIEQLSGNGYRCVIETVPYEFQRGGNEMLRVTSA